MYLICFRNSFTEWGGGGDPNKEEEGYSAIAKDKGCMVQLKYYFWNNVLLLRHIKSK